MHVVYFNCNWIGFLSSECFPSLRVTSRNARGLNAYFITNSKWIFDHMSNDYWFSSSQVFIWSTLVFWKAKLLSCKSKLTCDRFIIEYMYRFVFVFYTGRVWMCGKWLPSLPTFWKMWTSVMSSYMRTGERVGLALPQYCTFMVYFC